MRHLDLFSGIGGFALAARWVGWETVGFCEIDPYCQKVLRKHWPDAPIYEDVKDVTAERLRTDGIECDLITGGFLCQDISYAGKGAGIDGKRSGLWSELARIISDIRPRYAVLENVAALLARGLERVTGDLAEIGYDSEWHCIPASAIGAPHRRDRIWIIARPNGPRHNSKEYPVTLAMHVCLWPTPRANDAEKRGNIANDPRSGLPAAVKYWPTPQASDNRDRGNLSHPSIQRRLAKGKQMMLSQVVSEISGALNPQWVEWLMGYPEGWTDLGGSETQLCRKSQK